MNTKLLRLRETVLVTSALGLVLACSAEPKGIDLGDDAGSGNSHAGGSGRGGGLTAGSGGRAAAQGGTGGSAGTPTTGGAGTPGSGGTMLGNTGGVGGGVAGTSSSSGGQGAMSAGGTLGSGGMTGLSGTGGTGGRGGAGGGAGMSGKGGAGGGGKGGGAGTGGGAGSGAAGGSSTTCALWPAANGSQSVSSTIAVSGTYDGTLKRFSGSGELGSSGQDEGQGPLFELADGATLKNVILGSPAADGVHCKGSCTLENVWWEDVGEDAATSLGSSDSTKMTIRCGGAKNASDKIFQHNGGGTFTIQNFDANTFGKLYRSCGNCSTQHGRHVVLQDITARSGSSLVGINTNYGDTADFDRITIYGSMDICVKYTGNSTGAEPSKTGSGADSQYCRYTDSDITQK